MTETKTINNREFEVKKFYAVKAFKLKTKIVKIIAEPLSSLIEDVEGDILTILVQELNISKAVHVLFENIENEDKLFSLILEILNQTSLVEGENDKMTITNEQSFNYVFKDGLKDLYELIAFVIKVNYADLLGAVAGNIGSLKDILQPTPASKKLAI